MLYMLEAAAPAGAVGPGLWQARGHGCKCKGRECYYLPLGSIRGALSQGGNGSPPC